MSEYIHYIQKEGQKIENLETAFGNIKYVKCVGLNTKGKPKNVYTESSAESDELRAWQGKEIAREATKITLTLYFLDNDKTTRMVAFDNLYKYICMGKFYYWDTARNRKAYCILADEYKPSEELWFGSTPYIAADIPLQCLWGECKKCDNDGNLI